ncbi:hypothetical protein SAMN04488012_11278 [Palleronia salina]|uniref:Uncharacterized protein n=1 Tax=Palleronia salina TaxID=313368 RepID=A0A1M6KNE1_9RHOB|nr:hypothetical protein SAMN04488012_11278 [Palleronia salina]
MPARPVCVGRSVRRPLRMRRRRDRQPSRIGGVSGAPRFLEMRHRSPLRPRPSGPGRRREGLNGKGSGLGRARRPEARGRLRSRGRRGGTFVAETVGPARCRRVHARPKVLAARSRWPGNTRPEATGPLLWALDIGNRWPHQPVSHAPVFSPCWMKRLDPRAAIKVVACAPPGKPSPTPSTQHLRKSSGSCGPSVETGQRRGLGAESFLTDPARGKIPSGPVPQHRGRSSSRDATLPPVCDRPGADGPGR